MHFSSQPLLFSVLLVLASCGSSRALGGSRSVAARETQRVIPAGAVILRGERVTVGAFAIDRVPVTCRDYWDFTASRGVSPPAPPEEAGIDPALPRAHAFAGRTPPARYLAHPMVALSHDEARAFCAWRGMRLPTEAEWTRAVYGDDDRPFPWGATPDASRVNSSEFGAGDTVAVLTHPRGAGPFDVADGAGQVREWTDTREGDVVVLVGSSWREPLRPRTASPRALVPAHARSLTLGFRCVRDVSP